MNNALSIYDAVKNISIEQWHLLLKYAEDYDIPVFPKEKYSYPSGTWDCVCFNEEGQIDICTEHYQNANWITFDDFVEKVKGTKVLHTSEHYKECLKSLLEGIECNHVDELLNNGSPADYRRLGSEIANKIKTVIFEKQ